MTGHSSCETRGKREPALAEAAREIWGEEEAGGGVWAGCGACEKMYKVNEGPALPRHEGR